VWPEYPPQNCQVAGKGIDSPGFARPGIACLAVGQGLWYNLTVKLIPLEGKRLCEEVSCETYLTQVTGQNPGNCFWGSQFNGCAEYGFLHHPHASTTPSHADTDHALTHADYEPDAYSIAYGQSNTPYSDFHPWLRGHPLILSVLFSQELLYTRRPTLKDRYFAGIDSGTSTTKAVIIDPRKVVRGSFVKKTAADLQGSAMAALAEAIQRAGVSRDEIARITATGYGRSNISFAHDTRTEIACHSKGCYHYFPEAITVVDIGGQDSKIIKLDAQGHRISFKMNRKCAAGTGSFLEEIAYKLDIPLEDLDRLARDSRKETVLGSYCTVFTATEVLDRIRAGEKIEDIVKGLFRSVVKRIREMDVLTGRVVMSGGVVAFNPIVAELLSAELQGEVVIAPHPQEMGAFGAALFAMESVKAQGGED